MFTTTWSQKLLCSCKGHQDATWHHGFATIVNMATCSIIFEFILIYLNDLKLGTKKYHLLLQPIITNNDSISNDDDVACHLSMRCYN
jgi:hypothetical protein